MIKKRLAKDKIIFWSICLFAVLTAVPLLAILGEVFFRGYDQLTWSFFTEPTPTAYKAMKAIEAGEPIPGGIANGIIGTMLMLGMAAVFAIPIGILCGVFLAENSKNRFAQTVSYLTDLLQGTPSVIIGIITYVSRQCGSLYHDDATHYPFDRRDLKNSSSITKRGRFGTWR